MRPRRLALLALALLGGCQSLPPPAAAPTPAAQAALATLDTWRARGRVAVRSRAEGFGASFDWREAAGRGEIDVRGPLGAGAARITRSAEAIRIETASGPPLEIAAPFTALESELTARLGFPLPIGPLRYWLLGVPDPALPSEAGGQGFAQAGWTVALAQFAPVAGSPAPLPSRLVLKREATEIRVLVSSWTVAAP